MALIICPECGGKISDKANACIHCGCPIKDKPKVDHKSSFDALKKSKEALDYCKKEKLGIMNVNYPISFYTW